MGGFCFRAAPTCVFKRVCAFDVIVRLSAAKIYLNLFLLVIVVGERFVGTNTPE